jgi:hypothetical protein
MAMALAGAFLAGLQPALCDELRIDGRTQEAFSRSMNAIAASLTPGEREAYKRGLMNIILANYPPAAKAKGAALVAQINPALKAARATLNGMTKEEIVAHGRELLKNPLPRAN